MGVGHDSEKKGWGGVMSEEKKGIGTEKKEHTAES